MTRGGHTNVRHHPLLFDIQVALDPAQQGVADAAPVAQSVDRLPLSFEYRVDNLAVLQQFLLRGRAGRDLLPALAEMLADVAGAGGVLLVRAEMRLQGLLHPVCTLICVRVPRRAEAAWNAHAMTCSDGAPARPRPSGASRVRSWRFADTFPCLTLAQADQDARQAHRCDQQAHPLVG